MSSLNSLVSASTERRERNLERLRAISKELDRDLYVSLPVQARPPESRSIPEPTRTDRSDDGLADLLPARRTRGGSYGGSILERVARSYGIIR